MKNPPHAPRSSWLPVAPPVAISWTAYPASLFAQATPATNAAKDEVVELSPFTVTGEEGRGYLYSTSTIGTRTNRQTIEIPQSINMVTGRMREDTLAFKEEDAVRYVPNVFPRNTYGAPGQYLIRGFEREGSTYL